MSSFLRQEALILASGSTIRYKLMCSLGLEFSAIPSHCDESAIKSAAAGKEPVALGHLLAQSKALEVSSRHPEAFIIAADQLCLIDDTILDKPMNHTTATTHLKMLSGKTHQQIACMSIAKDNKILWQHHEIAFLTMHHLSEETINTYLESEHPYQSCGAYQFETRGKWLYKDVQGSEDTILGLPLLPLIEALVTMKAVNINY